LICVERRLRLAIASIISYAAFQIIPLLLIAILSGLSPEYAVIISMILAMLVSAIPSSILLKNSYISFLPPLVGGLISFLVLILLSNAQIISSDLASPYFHPYYIIIVIIASGLSIGLSRIYPKPVIRDVEGIKEVKVEEVKVEEVIEEKEKPPEKVEEKMERVEEAPKPEFIKCPHCGQLIPSDSIFCPLCGGKVGEKSEE